MYFPSNLNKLQVGVDAKKKKKLVRTCLYIQFYYNSLHICILENINLNDFQNCY